MTKKTKVLLVIPNPEDGTFFYRGAPYLRLHAEIEIANAAQWIPWHTIYNTDIVVFQRPANQMDVIQMEQVKKFRKSIVMDVDDNGFFILPDNPAYEFYNRDDKQACMRQCLKLADIVTVSTQALKEALLKEVPEADIRVVPNAIDDKIFDTSPKYHERNKIILMRGASSHTNDWLEYKDGVLEILITNPEYKLAVFGFHPDWLKEIPQNQIQYFKFQDIPGYFDTLMQLRPEIMIVPLLDNEFNRAKSAISLFEGVLAGAAVLSAQLPEFEQYGSCQFNSNETLKLMFQDLTQNEELWHFYYEGQMAVIPKLSDINWLRADIVEELKNSTKKYSPSFKDKTIATDKEFFDYSLSHGHTQDDEQYRKAHEELAGYLVKTLSPRTALELGCGTGGTLLPLLKAGVMAYGIEYNSYNVQYFKDNYPMYENQIKQADLTIEPIEVDEPTDLIYSIEVFEHISMSDEWWDQYISKLASQCRYFYFSSTPYSDPEAFTTFWNHCNIRRSTSWIKLFEKNGFTFVTNPKQITSWDLLFKSNLVK